MKKILTIIAFLGISATGSFAQQADGPIDLQALIALPLANTTLNQNGNLDTNKVLCGIRCNTPDSILSVQSVLFYSSFNNFPTSTTVSASGFSFVNDMFFADTSTIFIFPNANELGAGHVSPFTLSADSIKALCDWDSWQNDTFVTINRADLIPGKAYGFFFKAMGVQPEGAGVNEYRLDPVFGTNATNGNNRTAVKVIWGTGGTSIENLLAKKDRVNLNLYPNPASDKINFSFDFAKPSHVTIVVRDITGKIVFANNYGRVLSGTQQYSINIASLNAGNYILQFETDEQTAVAKFTNVKK